MRLKRDSSDFIEFYKKEVLKQSLQTDPAQLRLASALEETYQLTQLRHKNVCHYGLYIWGPVGRGKTFLMDLFFEYCQKAALRLHFHRFMARIHQRMTELQGHKDPLAKIARELSAEYRLICFDEFFLNDVADAMILGRLLKYLFKHNIVLITTSNRPPAQLCKDPLFQDRVDPLIQLITAGMTVHHMNGDTDHRLRQLTLTDSYFTIQAEHMICPLSQHYQALSQSLPSPVQIEVMGRNISAIGASENCIWFNFDDLCLGPRSQLDYIELANRYSHVLLSNVPPMGGEATEQIKARGTEDGGRAVKAGERQVLLGKMDDCARRFISLIDELYDRNVNFYMTTQVPFKELYTQGSLLFEFDRTHSRLTEMQSREYQQQPHKAV